MEYGTFDNSAFPSGMAHQTMTMGDYHRYRSALPPRNLEQIRTVMHAAIDIMEAHQSEKQEQRPGVKVRFYGTSATGGRDDRYYLTFNYDAMTDEEKRNRVANGFGAILDSYGLKIGRKRTEFFVEAAIPRGQETAYHHAGAQLRALLEHADPGLTLQERETVKREGTPDDRRMLSQLTDLSERHKASVETRFVDEKPHHKNLYQVNREVILAVKHKAEKLCKQHKGVLGPGDEWESLRQAYITSILLDEVAQGKRRGISPIRLKKLVYVMNCTEPPLGQALQAELKKMDIEPIRQATQPIDPELIQAVKVTLPPRR